MGYLAVGIWHLLASFDSFVAFRAPYIVVLKDRGQTLRFYQASQLRLKVDLIRDFLKTEAYEATKPWTSSFSPGGSRYFAARFNPTLLSYLTLIKGISHELFCCCPHGHV